MYNKTIWKDRVVDPVSGAVVQEGTFMSAEHFNNIEDGIAAVDSAIADISGGYEDIEEALETGVGTTVSLTLNQSTFVLNLALKNSKGTKISEQSVDLPIESMIVNAEYVVSTKSLVLTLQSGSKVTVPLSGLISGLVNDTRKVAGIDLKDDITVSELKTALDVDTLEQNKVNKATTVNGKALSSNITLAGSDLKLNATSYTKDSTSKTISKDTKVDEAVAQIEYRVDKKVDKATASTSQYTTSTVTVPACLGYAGVKMVGGKTVKSKNLFDFTSWMNGITWITRGNCTIANNSLTITASEADCFTDSYGENGISFNTKANTTYTLSWNSNNKNGHIYVFNGNSETVISYTNNAEHKYTTFVAQSNSIKIRFGVENAGDSITYSNIQLEEGTTVTAYEPYHEDLWNAPVEKIVSKDTDGNVKTTISVPDAIKNLPDYGCSAGSVYNWVDFENGVYHHNVGSVELSTLAYEYNEDAATYYTGDLMTKIKKDVPHTEMYNAVSEKYNMVVYNDILDAVNNISVSMYGHVTAKSIGIPSGVFCYELADDKKEVKPISAFVPPISCEEGGTITLVSEHSLDVPNKIVFKKEVI